MRYASEEELAARAKSDTPRTDVEEFVEKHEDYPLVDAAFARQLERELNEARQCLSDAIFFRDTNYSAHDLNRWLKAAGLDRAPENASERKDQ